MIPQLHQLRHSLEVAADTLHPDLRKLLAIVGQESSTQYLGHPHEWVTTSGQSARRLTSTYDHQPGRLNYQFIDEYVIDQIVFGMDDPRRMPQADPHSCPICQQQQFNVVHWNRCNCFPALFGCPKNPLPLRFATSVKDKKMVLWLVVFVASNPTSHTVFANNVTRNSSEARQMVNSSAS